MMGVYRGHLAGIMSLITPTAINETPRTERLFWYLLLNCPAGNFKLSSKRDDFRT